MSDVWRGAALVSLVILLSIIISGIVWIPFLMYESIGIFGGMLGVAISICLVIPAALVGTIIVVLVSTGWI